MELTINQKKENLLLERQEIKGSLAFEGSTPSNQQILEVLAKDLKVEPSLIIVKHIYTEFSKSNASFDAVAYSNEKAKNHFELVTKHMRKKMEEQKKAAAEKAPPAEKSEEPVEAKPEAKAPEAETEAKA